MKFMFRRVTGLRSVPEFSPPTLVLNSLGVVQQPPPHPPGVPEAGVQDQGLRGPPEEFQEPL